MEQEEITIWPNLHNFLSGKNIVVYDCEIENVIDNNKITWDDHDKMGLSVACLYDYQDGDSKVYLAKDAQALAGRLASADLVVAFNQISFDNKLVRACGGDLPGDFDEKCFDMLVEGRKGIGWTPAQRFPRGMKLDNFLGETFGDNLKKTDHGANAPILWQEGKVAEVITYCLADIRRERMLFEHICQYGVAENPTHKTVKFDLTKIIKAVGQ